MTGLPAIAGKYTHMKAIADSDLDITFFQVVNGPNHPGAVGLPPSKVTPPPPAVPEGDLPERSWRAVLEAKGPEGWAKDIRAHSGLLLTDTTWCAVHPDSKHPYFQLTDKV